MITSSPVSRGWTTAVVGLVALSLTACGSSSAPSSTPSAASAHPPATASSAPPAKVGRDHVVGLVGSVSGGTVTVSGPDGRATVDVTPATRVTQVVTGRLTDVMVGECLVARPTRDSGGQPTVTAAAVLFGPPVNGQCARGKRGRGLAGTVASVDGNSITLTAADGTSSTVAVTQATRYAKRAVADPSAIVTGQCLLALGTKDTDGNLQATVVSVRPSHDDSCGARRHRT